MVDAGKKAGVAGAAGEAAKKEPGRLITPQLDTTSVGLRVSLSSISFKLQWW